MNTYRQQMPPMSYLTLLDRGLIVNLALIAFCVLVVVASAVAPRVLWLDYFILHQNIIMYICSRCLCGSPPSLSAFGLITLFCIKI